MQNYSPYLAVTVVGVVLVIVFSWGIARNRNREKGITASRPADTQEGFVMSFRPEVQPIARALYIELQQYTATGRLAFRKSDRVTELLRMERVDLDEALKHVANCFGCRNPTEEDDSRFRGRATFEDFVEFIHHLRSTDPHAEHSSAV